MCPDVVHMWIRVFESAHLVDLAFAFLRQGVLAYVTYVPQNPDLALK